MHSSSSMASARRRRPALPDLKYRLVRVLGQIYGLGWSQLNVNAITGTPQPTADDLAGLPVMHAQDLPSCAPISTCYPLADQPKMDDRAALARLYPVTDDNLPECPGKQVFAESTGRIHGSVYFTDASGNRDAAHARRQRGRSPGGSWHAPAIGTLRSGFRVGLTFFRATPGMRSPDSMTHLDKRIAGLDRTIPRWKASSISRAWRFPAAAAHSTNFQWNRSFRPYRGASVHTLLRRYNPRARCSPSS